MQEGPRVEKCLITIQFLATYVKLAYGPVHHGYIKITSNGMDVEVLVNTDRGF